MLKMEKLIELVASEALINRVRECSLWRDLYALPDRSLMRVKQVMESHIWVEKLVFYDTSLLIFTMRFKR